MSLSTMASLPSAPMKSPAENTLTPETFLPLSIMIEKRNDSHITVTFSDHQINPTPEPDEKFFDLGTDGYTVKHPQKED